MGSRLASRPQVIARTGRFASGETHSIADLKLTCRGLRLNKVYAGVLEIRRDFVNNVTFVMSEITAIEIQSYSVIRT
jgi:hypothetical protein